MILIALLCSSMGIFKVLQNVLNFFSTECTISSAFDTGADADVLDVAFDDFDDFDFGGINI